jgi:acetolactate synthase I/II/III large subunit
VGIKGCKVSKCRKLAIVDPDFGMTFGNPDFVAYAAAYAANGSRLESADDLAPTLEAAFTRGGVQLVTVPIDYSENLRVLVEELRDQA